MAFQNHSEIDPILIYVLKLWIGTFFISALLIQINGFLFNTDLSPLADYIGNFFIVSLLGSILSFPAMLVLILVIKFISSQKMFLVVTAISLVVLSFLIVDFNIIAYPSENIFVLIYSAVISFLIMILKLNPEKK